MFESFESYLTIISGLIAIVTFVIWIRNKVLNPIRNYFLLKKSSFNLTGEWISSWEPKARNESLWVDEIVTITMTRFGQVRIINKDNSEGYDFTCDGKIYKTDGNRQILGTWHSNDSKNGKKGRFLLLIQRNGYMWGNLWGPNSQEVDMSGGWILARNEYDIKYCKFFYEKGYITDKESEFLGKNKKRLQNKRNTHKTR